MICARATRAAPPLALVLGRCILTHSLRNTESLLILHLFSLVLKTSPCQKVTVLLTADYSVSIYIHKLTEDLYLS
jgi:hypothetical protein